MCKFKKDSTYLNCKKNMIQTLDKYSHVVAFKNVSNLFCMFFAAVVGGQGGNSRHNTSLANKAFVPHIQLTVMNHITRYWGEIG